MMLLFGGLEYSKILKNTTLYAALQLPYGLKYIVPPEIHGTSLQEVPVGTFGIFLNGNKDVSASVKPVGVCLGGGMCQGLS